MIIIVVPVCRFLEKKVKLEKMAIKTPVRNMIIQSQKPLLKSTVTKILASASVSAKTGKGQSARDLFGTATKITNIEYQKHLASIPCRVDTRSVKKSEMKLNLTEAQKERVKRAMKTSPDFNFTNIVRTAKIASKKNVEENINKDVCEVKKDGKKLSIFTNKFLIQIYF